MSCRSEGAVMDPIQGQETGTDNKTDKAMGWKVLLWNCSCHSFVDVHYALQKATRCSIEKAQEYAQQIHETGQAVVYSGHKERCEAVAWCLTEAELRATLTK